MTFGKKKAMIEAALPQLSFEHIPVLLFLRDDEEVEELAAETGLLISESRLPQTRVAGNRVVNTCEIWLYPDGTLHEYLKAATWETAEGGCTLRLYVGPASEQKFSLEELSEAIEFNIALDRDK
jgi:hypothetical protein